MMPTQEDTRAWLLDIVPQATTFWRKKLEVAGQARTKFERQANIQEVGAPDEPTPADVQV